MGFDDSTCEESGVRGLLSSKRKKKVIVVAMSSWDEVWGEDNAESGAGSPREQVDSLLSEAARGWLK